MTTTLRGTAICLEKLDDRMVAEFVTNALRDHSEVGINDWLGNPHSCHVLEIMGDKARIDVDTACIAATNPPTGQQNTAGNQWVYAWRLYELPVEPPTECTCPPVLREGQSVCPVCAAKLQGEEPYA